MTGAVARFPPADTIAALAADSPHWAPSTTGLRGLDLSMHLFPAGVLGSDNLIGRIAELKVQILDYPGEWLLDLPLLDQSYEDWSRATLHLARRGVRAPLARQWLGFLDRHPPSGRSGAQTAHQAR